MIDTSERHFTPMPRETSESADSDDLTPEQAKAATERARQAGLEDGAYRIPDDQPSLEEAIRELRDEKPDPEKKDD